MSEKPYFSADGVLRTAIEDNDRPGQAMFGSYQDVEPILDSIHRDRELMPNSGHNKLVCRIPTVIYEALQRAGIADDPDLFKAWLNGPEAAPWRVWQGTV